MQGAGQWHCRAVTHPKAKRIGTGRQVVHQGVGWHALREGATCKDILNTFDRTLTWGSSRCSIVDRDSVSADMNFEGSLHRCASTR